MVWIVIIISKWSPILKIAVMGQMHVRPLGMQPDLTIQAM
jgi:hypothetical protein